MKRILFLLLFPFLFVACKPEQEAAPIAADKMLRILADIHIAEIYSSMLDDSTHQPKIKNLDSLATYYQQIFAHHKVSEPEFQQSVEWYRNNPGDLDTVYKRMIEDIAALEKTVTPSVTPAPAVK